MKYEEAKARDLRQAEIERASTVSQKPLDLSRFAGHTPGPWGTRDGIVYDEASGFDVAETVTPDSGSAESNAHLIAEAPQLLSVYLETRRALECCVEAHACDEDFAIVDADVRARAALALAVEGDSDGS